MSGTSFRAVAMPLVAVLAIALPPAYAASGGRLYVVVGNENGRYLYCFGP